jgi:hypothetical protein
MNYLTILEMAVSRRSFRLHPGLSPEHYQITENLREFERWRVITHCGTSYSEDWIKSQGLEKNLDPGAMMEVGYIMISLKDDTIIPIARGDEHHRGYDVLSDEIAEECRRNGHSINTKDYIPIWGYGSNYIYHKSEIPDMLIALEKFLSYGGRDGPLQGSNDLRNLVMNSSEFVARKGKIAIKPGTLAPAGKIVHDELVKLASAIRAANPDQRSSVGAAFQAAKKFVQKVGDFSFYLNIDYKTKVQEIFYRDDKKINELQKAGDLAGLEKLFFGFNGVKNEIHNAIRGCNERKRKGENPKYDDDRIEALWGDTKLAEDMLGRI